MPKHIIEFTLPEEAPELETIMNAGAYCSAIWEIRNILRKYQKYYEFTEQESARDFFEKLSNELYEILATVPD